MARRLALGTGCWFALMYRCLVRLEWSRLAGVWWRVLAMKTSCSASRALSLENLGACFGAGADEIGRAHV